MSENEKDLVDYFIERTDAKFIKIDERFNKVEQKLDLLFQFKWQIIGGSVIMSFIVSVGVGILAIIFNK